MPPMGGFFGKLFIFCRVEQGAAFTWLVILGLINSAISIVYYVNVVWRMYGVEPAKRERLRRRATVNVTMAVCVVGILASRSAFGVLLNQVRRRRKQSHPGAGALTVHALRQRGSDSVVSGGFACRAGVY